MDDNMPQGHDENIASVEVPSKESSGKAGPIIGIVVIILVLLLGVLYFWGQRIDTSSQEQMEANSMTVEQNSPEAIQDDFSDLEQQLDDEFATMDAELETEF